MNKYEQAEQDVIESIETSNLNLDFGILVNSLVKDPSDIAASLTPQKIDAWHAATGVATEAGEALDAIKKFVIYGKPLDRENLIEELGDLEFYMLALRNACNITREETLRATMKKLRARYGAKYSDQAAQLRVDKETETESSGLVDERARR